MEYSIYPFKYMRISQRHDEGNHKAHNIPFKNYSDKPWDEACKDSGRSYFEPQNDFKIVEILGLNTSTTNSVRLESVNKLKIPYKEEPVILELTLTHMNEDNLRQVHVGQILGKGSKILLEGTDGVATGNHFHVTANIGGYYGFKKNSNNKWCFVYEKSLTPPEAFYINDSIDIINANGYKFQEVPNFLPSKGYFSKGDSGSNVSKICDYFSNLVKGDYYGDYLESCVKVFQKQNNLESDGSIGKITLSKMKEKGFKE